MKLIAALAMLLAFSACSLPVFFRVPIVQGNIVTADQVAKLKTGMTRKQVAYVLGTPLIKSPFEADRWDYVFYYRNPRAHVRQSKLDLYFADNKLTDIEGNEEYMTQAMTTSQQLGAGTPPQLPGGTSSIGAPLGSMKKSRSGANNASDKIPHTDTSRPGTNQTPPGPGQPAGSTRPGNNGAIPNTGAPPLPGNPG